MSSVFSLLLLTFPLSFCIFLFMSSSSSSSSSNKLYSNPVDLFISPRAMTRSHLLQIFTTTSFVAFFGALVFFHYNWRRRRNCQRVLLIMKDKRRTVTMMNDVLVPKLCLTDSGRVDRFETFSQYVARQMGFGDPNECPRMCKLAEDYLRKSQGCERNMYDFFDDDPKAESLFLKLKEELDRCILAYFAFHWNQATFMISQVLSLDSEPGGKLRNMVMAATSGATEKKEMLGGFGCARKQRFERVTKDLKVTRLFSTLVEELKAIGMPPHKDDSKYAEVMVPADHSRRSPILLLLGGGMGAGKSTVLKDILKDSFWSEAARKAVIIEADAFKETDVIYKALSSRGHHDLLQTAELVHQSSTDAASSLLVTALNEGRDVIMDGTLSWEPFVFQTIEMARNVHQHRYRMGVGYKLCEDGTITENYWEQVRDDEQQDAISQDQDQKKRRKPYRIELLGVVCDAHLAVARGIRRAILMGRAVRVKSQLTSHKRFANAFPKYCELVDNARLYCTNNIGSPPKLIGWKDGGHSLLVDPQQINCLKAVSMLNEDADSIHELYQHLDDCDHLGPIWKDNVLSASRLHVQKELKIAIQKIEQPALHR